MGLNKKELDFLKRVCILFFYFLQEAFTLFDKKGDDKVDAAQIIDILRSLELNPLTVDVKKVIKDSSLENTRVDFPTFVSIYEEFKKRPTIANHEDMIEMFKTFDRDNSKCVFGGEIRQILFNMGDTMTEDDIQTMVGPHENPEGYIPYEALLQSVMSKKK